jgi:hypothetical protein
LVRPDPAVVNALVKAEAVVKVDTVALAAPAIRRIALAAAAVRIDFMNIPKPSPSHHVAAVFAAQGHLCTWRAKNFMYLNSIH